MCRLVPLLINGKILELEVKLYLGIIIRGFIMDKPTIWQVFFGNSWVVSIITGIVVYIITKIWENFRAKKQYIQSVNLANREVFNTLKLCVPEENLPERYVLESLHYSTAKKYHVKQSDMDSLSMIIFDLIKEIMDSNFLSYDAKTNYCSKLKLLDISITTPDESESNKDKGDIEGLKLELASIKFDLRTPFKELGITLIIPLISSIVAFFVSDQGSILFTLIDARSAIEIIIAIILITTSTVLLYEKFKK